MITIVFAQTVSIFAMPTMIQNMLTLVYISVTVETKEQNHASFNFGLRLHRKNLGPGTGWEPRSRVRGRNVGK